LTFAVDDHVFAISDHVRSSIPVPRAFRLLGTPRLETLYHGLDPVAAAAWPSGEGVRSELGIPAGAPIVGHVGNFRTLKGHRILLEAAVIVRREFPEARFVLLGQGPVEAEIRHHAQQLGLNGSVVFAGWREDAPRVVGAFDVFVLPSIYEGLSIALLEAMAQGKPSVVSRVGGLPELIDHEHQGLLVEPGDPAELAQAILRLLRDPQLRSRLGVAARQRAAEFDIRRTVERIEQVYGELVP